VMTMAAIGGGERRNLRARALVVRCIVTRVIQCPGAIVSIDMLREWCNIPIDAAHRILHRLTACGLVREIQTGVFLRGALHPSAVR
jgi:hypothetical protein